MRQLAPNAIPLPCAVLALSVAVCIGSAGAASAQTLPGSLRTEAQQRETLEQIIVAIQQAARELGDKLDGQVVATERATIRPVLSLAPNSPLAERPASPTLHLREALLNLPPPTC